MSDRLVEANQIESEDGYEELRDLLAAHVESIGKVVLYRVNVSGSDLWDIYLQNMPASRRQHYTCSACRKFFERYGNLVYMEPSTPSVKRSYLFSIPETQIPHRFRKAFRNMKRNVEEGTLRGVFLSEETVWGQPETGTWTHLYVRPSPKAVCNAQIHSADAQMAKRDSNFEVLSQSLVDYPINIVQKAEMLISSDALYNSDKVKQRIQWFLKVHTELQRFRTGRAVDSENYRTVLWHFVGEAPEVGFTNVRSDVVHTLLDDLKAGLPFETVKDNWARKLHPMKYQRPVAPPKEGNIDRAEKLFEKMNIDLENLDRRAAIFEEVQKPIWIDGPIATGMFAALRNQARETRTGQTTLGTHTMSWNKFEQDILPRASAIQAYVPSGFVDFFGLTTAVKPDGKPLLQWDGLEGQPRNQVSWYFYNGGSLAVDWGLRPNTWVNLKGIFYSPHAWQRPDLFGNHGMHVFFALHDCVDKKNPGLALFKSQLRKEFNEVGSVIELHSNRNTLKDTHKGTANGLAMRKAGKSQVQLKVTMDVGSGIYTLDRFE